MLVVSASMGAGHDGAAHELARRLEVAGHRVRVVDLFDAAPRVLAWLWRESYRCQLRFAPGMYERSYRLYYRRSRSWQWTLRVLCRIARTTLIGWVRETEADVVVSTYALGTLILGELHEGHLFTPPLVNFLTDFGVHPRTVHRGVDLHLAVHEVAAEDARRYVHTPVVATGPAVSPRFRDELPSRNAARAALDLGSSARVVLVVAGSWGVGHDLLGTVRALTDDGRFTVITLCGRDERLRRELTAAGLGRVSGWTDQLPRYLAAADVLVENAGGLTAMEACAAGVPVVSFRPIPGHGRDNVRSMQRAGVSSWPADLTALCRVVGELTADTTARTGQIAAARAMFCSDPTNAIVTIARASRGR